MYHSKDYVEEYLAMTLEERIEHIADIVEDHPVLNREVVALIRKDLQSLVEYYA